MLRDQQTDQRADRASRRDREGGAVASVRMSKWHCIHRAPRAAKREGEARDGRCWESTRSREEAIRLTGLIGEMASQQGGSTRSKSNTPFAAPPFASTR